MLEPLRSHRIFAWEPTVPAIGKFTRTVATRKNSTIAAT